MRIVLRILIRAYQLLLSPMLGPRCRFHPSCSQYALEALELHGALRGTLLALRRLSRCHPFHAGGYDPVPPPRVASHVASHVPPRVTSHVPPRVTSHLAPRVPPRVRPQVPHVSQH